MNDFQNSLKLKMDDYVHLVYRLTKSFPKGEIYSSVSQWRRSSLPIILNYIEGYARVKILVRLNFLEISYGSLKESRYLLEFSKKENFITIDDYNFALSLVDEIGAMLWTEISSVKKNEY